MDSALAEARRERFHPEQAKRDDERQPGERDYDRILYSSAFLRLAGVAQVAHTEDHCVVHNRLIHSLKVARVGRGLIRKPLPRCFGVRTTKTHSELVRDIPR